MNITSLLYHDIVKNNDFNTSGFTGPTANVYKFSIDDFKKHLMIISNNINTKPLNVYNILSNYDKKSGFILTFDDGGINAINYIADLLEKYGWIGHFFITVKYIGKKYFLSRNQLVELRKRGHIIGSHSFSHPKNISKCTWKQIIEEWEKSVDILSNMIGENVSIASVPGGFYSNRLAQAASYIGIKALFTSEPITRCFKVNNCLVLGRFTLQRGMKLRELKNILKNKYLTHIELILRWNIKKLIKRLFSNYYIRVRKKIFSLLEKK